MSEVIRIGFSPCPNDTFLFDALVNGKMNTENYRFEPVLADVEELNQMAMRGELEVTKLSYHAFMHMSDRYAMLYSGSALGNNCGPLLIARPEYDLKNIANSTIAIPGEMTTANFLLNYSYPEAKKRDPMIFSAIENAVLEQQVDCGVIIHENRFTYADKGLMKIRDLGEYWEQQTGLPIPLGGIAVRRDVLLDLQWKINDWISESTRRALDNPDDAKDYVSCHAQEMDREVMYSHIRLYVNDYTVNLGESGVAAVKHMQQHLIQSGSIPANEREIFITK
jgi:1,4-dihydroxy-6-naphthoate synthase